jgi:hypothetical protein
MPLANSLEGGCICGKLRYHVSDLPLVMLACHCNNCKHRSGAAFSLSMLTLRKDFEKLSGETITCDVPGGSGAMHRQHVCPSCLTRTHAEMLAHPEVINVRPGTLDTPAAVAPVAQIWTSLALPWALLPNIPHYEENPPDVPALMGLWRATHSAKLM